MKKGQRKKINEKMLDNSGIQDGTDKMVEREEMKTGCVHNSHHSIAAQMIYEFL